MFGDKFIVMSIYEDSIKAHRESRGKLSVVSKLPITNKRELSIAYTPGVAGVSKEIHEHPESVRDLTIKGNTVAVVTDGSAVLGLGNIGPEAALPVMEGKAALFKEFADVDAFPVCLDTQDPDEIVKCVKTIAPAFGGINLEDISAPRCFDIERRLQDIGIPVMHDDQHGTAIVVRAALINAAKVVDKPFSSLKVAISGAGAAGNAIAKLLLCSGYKEKLCTSVADVIVVDSKGIIHRNREDLDKNKKELAEITNKKNITGSLADAMEGADVFIGVSVGNIVSKDMVKSMSSDPIVFAMANPVPEISPEDAKDAGARVVATGRSDFPNQINNVLAFPGIFRGALDAHARVINDEMKLMASLALSECVNEPREDYIIPEPFDKKVVPAVASAVKKAAEETGACD